MLLGNNSNPWRSIRKHFYLFYWFFFYFAEAGKRISHRVYVVYAGMEPMTFKALFPCWNDTPDVIRIQKQVCNFTLYIACVASVSVRFRRKERGTRVKDREKSGASKRAGREWGRKEGNACRQTPGF